jgi:ABC-type glycerol-3-phosphate transport system substrate-binding protein
MTAKTRLLRLALLVGCAAMVARASVAQEITIWHDKGDDGIRMIQQMADKYKADHPGVTVKSVSMPTDQWFSRSIAALNTGTSPDILFNDNARIVTIQQSTGKLTDLTQQFQQITADDRRSINDGDIAASTYKERMLMIPFQRTMTGFGVRKSWFEAVGEGYPKTWDDAIRIGKKFQATPGRFGFAMQAGGASSMIDAGINLLVNGNGIAHSLVDEKGDIVVDRPDVARATIEYLKLFTEYKLVSPETVNQTFTDMYQLIEGGRVGMFRVGNWNVGKWDKTSPAGDYIVGPYPAIGGGTSSMVVGSVRGMAVPSNAPHKEAALEFVKFIVTKPAQQYSLDNMGGVIRPDVDTSGVTPGLKPFLAGDVKLQVDDFAASSFPWYLKLEDVYYRLLIAAVSSPPADWNAWIKETADKLRAEVATLKAKG